MPNKSLNRMRNQLAFYLRCLVRAGYLQRYAASIIRMNVRTRGEEMNG